MNQFKRAKVIMLPTEEQTKLWISKGTNILRDLSNIIGMKQAIGQHIYIISDDEIKEGDWYLQYGNLSGWKLLQSRKDISLFEKDKKIISTNDKTCHKNCNCSIVCTKRCEKLLPEPSQQFITKYIESYNKGEIITDVLVEYEKATYDKWFDNGGQPVFDTIKVNPKDNTITIRKNKDSWNREEHRVNIMYCLSLFATERGLTPTSKEMKIVNEWGDNWCNKNL